MKEIKILNNAGIKVPVITNAFYVDKGHYGYNWKIYIEAEGLRWNQQRDIVFYFAISE